MVRMTKIKTHMRIGQRIKKKKDFSREYLDIESKPESNILSGLEDLAMDISDESCSSSSASPVRDESPPLPDNDSDIALGVCFLSHLRHFCENCGTYDTPQWRKGWRSEVLNRCVLLCNACGLKYHKNQYCPYCKFIYGKEQDKIVSKDWISCQSCARWVHTTCEKRHGNCFMTENLDQQNHHLPIKTHGINSSANLYLCPDCKSSRARLNFMKTNVLLEKLESASKNNLPILMKTNSLVL